VSGKFRKYSAEQQHFVAGALVLNGFDLLHSESM